MPPHSSPSVDVLPDALLERIFALLSLTNVLRIAAVCKRWNSIVSTKGFEHLCEQRTSSRPWFFLSKGVGIGAGCAYDPHDERWLHCCEHSGLDKSGFWPLASANGLICFMVDNGQLFVCNPMTNFLKKLAEPSMKLIFHNCSVSMTANKDPASPTIILAQFGYVNSQEFVLIINEYDFSLQNWGTKGVTRVHRDGVHSPRPQSVICKGFMYCVVLSATHGHYLITYELSSRVLNVASMGPPPCSLRSLRLLNCNNKLVIVGGDGDLQLSTGIGIWELVDTQWREIARMPDVHFKTLHPSPPYSNGLGDFIYIHGFGAPHLFLYSVTERSWVRIERCLMAEEDKNAGNYLGICFEPRPKVSA